MTMAAHEPGTYRTRSGELVHSRAFPDGTIVLEREDGARASGEEELVKLSDDPYWPDLHRSEAVAHLFVD